MSRIPFIAAVLIYAACTVESDGPGQQPEALDPEAAEVLAVADTALAAITAEDMERFASLMIDEAISVPTTPRGYSVRTVDEWLASPPPTDIVERGFDPTVMVSGTVAMVWYPYDLYRDGEWSHCGVDVFTLARVDGAWRIASLAWSVEQPPACRRHPDGPP